MFKKHQSLFAGLLVVLLLAVGSCKSKYEKLKASNENKDNRSAFLLLFNNQKPALHTKQYSNTVDVTEAGILSHKAYGRPLKNKIISFISQIQWQQ